MVNVQKKYLAWFGHNNSYFAARFRELESLASMHGVDISSFYVGERPSSMSTDPYAVIRLPNDEIARKICQRSVLTRLIVELWGSGKNDREVIAGIRQNVSSEYWDELFLGPGKSFCYKVIGYGIQHTEGTRRARMLDFTSIFKGSEHVSLKSATTTLYIIDEHEKIFEQTGARNELIQADKKKTFYGRLVAESDGITRNSFVLTDRPVLGPTSLDNDLAFLMANMAEIESGKLVFDPFCGTGGLLLAATAAGGIPQVGTDIDIRVLRGEFVAYVRNQVEGCTGSDIFQNFRHYGIPKPEVVAMDNSHNCWRKSGGPLFDVILTDPPYGVRAGAKKIGAKYDHEIGNRDDYYPQMLGYQPNEVNDDLLSLAATLLGDNGTLVFLLHIELMDLFTAEELHVLPREATATSKRGTRICIQPNSKKEYVYANECARNRNFLDEDILRNRIIPIHPDLNFESAVLQILSAGTGRILVKMRRIARH